MSLLSFSGEEDDETDLDHLKDFPDLEELIISYLRVLHWAFEDCGYPWARLRASPRSPSSKSCSSRLLPIIILRRCANYIDPSYSHQLQNMDAALERLYSEPQAIESLRFIVKVRHNALLDPAKYANWNFLVIKE